MWLSIAKLILEGAKVNNGKPYRKQRRIYLISRGNKWEKHGNRNVKILKGDEFFDVKIKYPFAREKWINGAADFGAFNSVVDELAELAEQNLEVPFPLNCT